MTNKIAKSNFVEYAIVPLLLFATMVPSAIAKRKPEKPSDPITVIAHLPLPGIRVDQTFLQERTGKEYLYVQEAFHQGFTIIDVTKPYRPSIVSHVTAPNMAAAEELQILPNGLAIAETPDAGAGSASHELTSGRGEGAMGGSADGNTGSGSSRFVRLLDLNDPENPRTLRTFDGVSSVLSDTGRNLIYITDAKGLWILNLNVAPLLPLCNSQTAITDAVNCY